MRCYIFVVTLGSCLAGCFFAMLFWCPFQKGSKTRHARAEPTIHYIVMSWQTGKIQVGSKLVIPYIPFVYVYHIPNHLTRTAQKMLAKKELKKPDDLLGLAQDSEVEQTSDSDDDDERSKKLTQHRAKRRRVERIRADDDKDESDDAGDHDEEEGGAVVDPRFAGKFDGPIPAPDKDDEDEGAQKEVEEEGDPESSKLITNPSALKPLTPAQLAQSKEATHKTGVVYLSRIPPFMKPQKVRDLLSRFGAINRIFLAPEDPKAHAKRVKFGGNKKRNFVEGWVEFVDKKLAKLCAETLNTQTVGGKKGSYYHDDVWNIKYLRKFKWHHLQAQIGGFIILFPSGG